MANHRLYPPWGHRSEALRSSEPQNELKTGGPGLFEVLYADPQALQEFLAAMSGISRGANQAIARTFPWQQHRTFVDVGTAQGDLAVEPIFTSYVESHGLADRLRFAPGDFFLHDWDLPTKRMLIAKAFDALSPGGFDYTGADCMGWMREAGFSSIRVEPLVGPDAMVIGVK